MARVYNFSAGPAVLPEPVLAQAAAEMLDWRGSGMSVMEMSHRGKEFIEIAAEAERDLRELMSVPASYKVLFLQGGATGQFAAVPMNLLRGKTAADYVVTGDWSKKAAAEAKKYCRSPSGSCRRTPPTCTTRRTRPSAASSSTGCRRPAACRWSRTCPRPSCRGRWM
jgi:phosphoserine aminotransferase